MSNLTTKINTAAVTVANCGAAVTCAGAGLWMLGACYSMGKELWKAYKQNRKNRKHRKDCRNDDEEYARYLKWKEQNDNLLNKAYLASEGAAE